MTVRTLPAEGSPDSATGARPGGSSAGRGLDDEEVARGQGSEGEKEVRPMKSIMLAVVAMMGGISGCNVLHPPVCQLDGKPDYPWSTHSGHVRILSGAHGIEMDDGKIINPFFTAATEPYDHPTGPGVLKMVVPSYGSDGFIYYWISFVPDKGGVE